MDITGKTSPPSSESSSNAENTTPTHPTPDIKQEILEDVEPRTVANTPFVNKVWIMINEPSNHKYIKWMPGGKSIQIVDRDGFEKEILPKYFKHKRFTSFVRQLNMYGWHKVQDVNAGTMQSSEEHWQFANPYFIKNRPELLSHIVRNKGSKSHPQNANNHNHQVINNNNNHNDEEISEKPQNVRAVLRELEQIKTQQMNISEDLGRVHKENEMLWNEYYQTRERYDKHSQMLSRILRFLATVYGNQYKLLDMNNANELAQQAYIRQPSVSAHDPPFMHLNAQRGIANNAAYDSGIRDLKEIEQMQSQIQAVDPPSPGSTSSSISKPSSGIPAHSHITTTAVTPAHNVNSNHTQGASPNLVPNPVNTTMLGRPITNHNDIPIGNTHGNTNMNLSGNTNVNSNMNLSGNSNMNTNVNLSGNTNGNAGSMSSINSMPNLQGAHIDPIPLQQPMNPNIYSTNSNSKPDNIPVVTDRALTPVRELIPSRSRFNSLDYSQWPGLERSRQNSQLIRAPPKQSSKLNPYAMNYDDDPASFFPELTEIGQAPNLPPMTSQELEQISRELSNNGTSLQNIHEWLSKQASEEPPLPPVQQTQPQPQPQPIVDDAFNVDDFLANEDPKQPVDPAQLTEISEEPDRKKVKVA